MVIDEDKIKERLAGIKGILSRTGINQPPESVAQYYRGQINILEEMLGDRIGPLCPLSR